LLVVAASTGDGPGAGATSGRPKLEVRQITGTAVITNAGGFTLYWFAPDSESKSRCYGTCAAYWPPVVGAPRAGPGVTGKLGTIKRSDGSLQATYDGHPLYTYIGDSAPGQASGNRVNGGRLQCRAAAGFLIPSAPCPGHRGVSGIILSMELISSSVLSVLLGDEPIRRHRDNEYPTRPSKEGDSDFERRGTGDRGLLRRAGPSSA